MYEIWGVIKLSSSVIVHTLLQHFLHLSCTGNVALSSGGKFGENMNYHTVQIHDRLMIFPPHVLDLSHTWTCNFLCSDD